MLVIWFIQTPGYYNQSKLIELMRLLILRLSNQGFKLFGSMSDFFFFDRVTEDYIFNISKENPLILETFEFSLVHRQADEWKTQE